MYIHNPNVALQSISKLVKKNGLFLFSSVNRFGPYSLLNASPPRLLLSGLFGKSSSFHGFGSTQLVQTMEQQGFRLTSPVVHSDFVSFVYPFNRSKKICVYDCMLADKLPAWLVNGFFLSLKKV